MIAVRKHRESSVFPYAMLLNGQAGRAEEHRREHQQAENNGNVYCRFSVHANNRDCACSVMATMAGCLSLRSALIA